MTSIRTKQIEFLSHPTFPKIFCAWCALEFSFIYICCRRDTAPPCLPPQRRELGALPAPHVMKEGKGRDPLASSILEHLGCLLPGWRCCIQSLDILFLYGCLFSFSDRPSWWCSWGSHLPIGFHPPYHIVLLLLGNRVQQVSTSGQMPSPQQKCCCCFLPLHADSDLPGDWSQAVTCHSHALENCSFLLHAEDIGHGNRFFFCLMLIVLLHC